MRQLVHLELKQLIYGQYAGECGGYCIFEVLITPNIIVLTKRGWGNYVPEIIMRSTNIEEDWEKLIELVDYPLFESFPTVIGCPDCADQGGEFIEILYEEKTKRIDFNDSIDMKVNLLTTALRTIFVEKQTLFHTMTQ